MSESNFRILIGIILVTLLLWENTFAIYVYCAYLAFEFLTNIRFTFILNKIKGNSITTEGSFLEMDSERMLRLIVIAIVGMGTFYHNQVTWPIPWFVALMLVSAGITRICPMKMTLAWIGLK
jgi:type IV secretory pathway TraG/TraD family ATPase VirD4